MNKIKKYITSMGQNTGTLKASNKVQNIAINIAFVAEYQNLNSGNLRINGRNSSLLSVGNFGPSSKSMKQINRDFAILLELL